MFLIGNVPSLRKKDLDVLHKHDEVKLAFNRIYNIFDGTEWRSIFSISQDERMLKGCEKEVD